MLATDAFGRRVSARLSRTFPGRPSRWRRLVSGTTRKDRARGSRTLSVCTTTTGRRLSTRTHHTSPQRGRSSPIVVTILLGHPSSLMPAPRRFVIHDVPAVAIQIFPGLLTDALRLEQVGKKLGSSRETRYRTSLVHEEIHRHAHAHFHGDTVETCGRELPLPDRRERRVRELGVGGRQNPQVLEKAVGADAPFEEHRSFAAPPILRIPRLHISHLGRRPDASTDGDWLHGSSSGWLTDCRGGGGGGAGGASRPDGAGGGGGGGASLSEMLTLIVSWSDPSCSATSR